MTASVWACCLLSLHLLSAVKIKNLELYEDKVAVKTEDRLLIRCHYETDGVVPPGAVRAEWDVIKADDGLHLPVIRALDSLVVPLSQPNPYAERAQMFLSLLPNKNCSLVINPTLEDDSGTYQVKMFLDDEPYKEAPSIHVHVYPKNGAKVFVIGLKK
ncbi:uncharacterized protein [Ambystoma mexicanum]|uniref:uncharacterized protein isoform X2 n=1 Tax=Ambystoma mexicanum TaxID=8296 RepID=UPI0037E802D4